MDIKEALTFDGLKYFYTKYIKPLKTGAFATVVNNGTTTVENTVLDGRMGKTLADKDANLQNQINTLNSSLAIKTGNMKVIYVNQIGTYTFNLPIGQLAFVLTYRGVYPHYSSLSEITANQLISKEENVITSVNNANRTVSIYNKNTSEYTQAIVILSNQ